MIGMKEGQAPIFAQFAALAKERASELPWLRALRETALDQFAALGFPTKRTEEWKYTNVTPILDGAFQPPDRLVCHLQQGVIGRARRGGFV